MTTTARAAAEGVNYLKSIQGGRVTFLPMDSVKGKPYDTPALHESCVLGTAVDCIPLIISTPISSNTYWVAPW